MKKDKKKKAMSFDIKFNTESSPQFLKRLKEIRICPGQYNSISRDRLRELLESK